jgi:predicted RNA methylase
MGPHEWSLLVLLALQGQPEGVEPAMLERGLELVCPRERSPAPGELVAEGLVEETGGGRLRLTDAGREAAEAAADAGPRADQPKLQLLYEVKREATASADPFAGRELDPPPSLPRRVVPALRRLAGRLLYERGLDTSETRVRAMHFHPERVRYAPSGWMLLPGVLAHCEIGPTDVFVDFGAGKGRVLVQAAGHPFARVVGVEIDPELAEQGRRNLARARARLVCQEVELVTADAARWPVPDDMTYGFFFIPFTGEIARAVVANVVASLDRRARTVRLIYSRPGDHARAEDLASAIAASGRFAVEREERGERYGDNVVTVFAGGQ